MFLARFRQLIKLILLFGAGWLAKLEFRRQKFKRFNERPIEFSFVFSVIRDEYPVRILDVGTGTTALPHLFRNCGSLVTAIDNIRDYWPVGMVNPHFYVIDDDIRSPKIKGKFDLITCISVLEHVDKFDEAVKGLFSLLSDGGSLVITFPYSNDHFVPNVYELAGSAYGQDMPYEAHSFSSENVEHWIRENQVVLVNSEHWQCWTGDYWTVGEQIIPPRKVGRNEKHQLGCFHFKKCIVPVSMD